MPTTADRCRDLTGHIREHLDPAHCDECAAIAVLIDGLAMFARQGLGAPMAEALLAHAAQELGVQP